MEQELKPITKIDLPEAQITHRADGIVQVHFKKDVTIDMEAQLRLLDAYKKLLTKPAPFMFISEPGVTSTKEVREMSGELKKDAPIKASAVIVTNIAHALIASSYEKFNKPKHPYKVFNNTEEGIEWLKQYINN